MEEDKLLNGELLTSFLARRLNISNLMNVSPSCKYKDSSLELYGFDFPYHRLYFARGFDSESSETVLFSCNKKEQIKEIIGLLLPHFCESIYFRRKDLPNRMGLSIWHYPYNLCPDFEVRSDTDFYSFLKNDLPLGKYTKGSEFIGYEEAISASLGIIRFLECISNSNGQYESCGDPAPFRPMVESELEEMIIKNIKDALSY